MAKKKPFQKAESALREFALRFPESIEDHPWGHSAFKVKKKIFMIVGGTDEFLTISVKLPSSGRMALLQPYASPTGYGLGKSGWVTAKFEPGEDIPIERMCEWTAESYRAIAPKKLIVELDNPDEKPKPKKRKG